jgi:multiple sugar transport system ATP-binding protein
MIYVTHDQIEAMTMADKIVVMNAGHIEQVGTSTELYDRPANMFVAGFIGSPAMNFIPGPVMEQGADVTVGVRPEHFEIGDDGLAATVRLVEPLGSDTQITLDANGTEIVTMFHRRVAATPGDTLHLRPVASEMHRFDTATGRRL